MTDAEASRLLLVLKAAFAGRESSKIDQRTLEARDKLYASMLRELDAKTAERALRDAVRSRKFYPSWAEFQELYDLHARPRPELVKASTMLPPPGETTASIDEVRAACAKATKALAWGGPSAEVKR